jgi:zinc-binding in reverse transcriptase
VLTLAHVWNNCAIKILLMRGLVYYCVGRNLRSFSLFSTLSANFIGHDSTVWFLTSTGIYTVRSMYIFFLHSGCVNSSLMFLWDLKVPLKIKYFMWLILHGKILTRSNLSHRGWKGVVSCSFCSYYLETLDHLFLTCLRMQEFWTYFNQNNSLDVNLPSSSV